MSKQNKGHLNFRPQLSNCDRLQSTTQHQQPSQDEIIKKYLLKTQKQLCCNATRFTPATLNTRYKVDIADMFTDLELLKENEKKQDVKPTTLNEVLNIIKSTPACKVLIEGEGGIGKSTLLRFIAYNWASDKLNKTFEGKIVFLVNISSIDKGETFLDGILKQIDIEDFYLDTNFCQDPVLIKRFIRNNDNDIVLLLDGLDELREGCKSPISLFKKEKMPKCKVILTSRSEKIDEFVKESSIHVKVKGFSAVNVRNYIKKHFEYFREPALGDSLLDELKLNSEYEYKHMDIKSMCKNPMLLLSVCIMWEEKQHLPANKADLFKEIIRTILNQFIEKQGDKEQKISVFENISQKYVELMLLLGKCMYNGLKQNQLSINKGDLEGKEEMVALALKLGFVYKDTPNLKSDFEEIFTAPHKLIVESLVGFYLCKLCQAAALKSKWSEGMEKLLQPLDDSEWNIIRESEHLNNAREFAIGFLGTGAGMFLNHWVTNSLSTYRSLMAHFKFVKIEHRRTVEKQLFDTMSKKCLEIMPHINDVCESLRKIIYHFISDVELNQTENFFQIMQIFIASTRFSARIGRNNFKSWFKFFSAKEMSSEKKCKIIAHIMIVVSDQRDILHIANKICGDDIRHLTAECQKLNFKYDITQYTLYSLSTASFIVHLFSFAPQLRLLQCNRKCITGVIMNDTIRECSSQGVMLELKELNISSNNLKNILDSSLASFLVIAPTLSTLSMSSCCLSGIMMNGLVKECLSQGVKLELKKLDISDNNLSNIDGSSLASFLVIASTLSTLHMSNSSLSGAIMNDLIIGLMGKCRSQGVQLVLKEMDISGNNLSKIEGSLLSSLLVVAPALSTLHISNCSLSGVIINDMMRELCSRGVKLELKALDISGNDFCNIDGSLFVSFLGITSKLQYLSMSNGRLSCYLGNIDYYYYDGFNGDNLYNLDICGNILNIDGSSLASLLITTKLNKLTLKKCNLSGGIVNDMVREFCSRSPGIKLELKELDISGNNLSDIDGSLLESLLIIAPSLSTLNIGDCSLSGVIVNDMIRECCSHGVELILKQPDDRL